MVKNVTIWNDNQYTDNYRLSFDVDGENPPEKLVLTETDDDKNNPPEKWRFEIVGKEYIDNADANLQTQIDDATTRITAVEEKNVEQDSRLEVLEESDRVQDNRLDLIEAKNVEQDDEITTIKAKDEEQDSRLDLVESKNTEQDSRLDALDGGQTGQDGRIDTIENEIQNDICKLAELTLPYPMDVFPIGLYRVEANFRVHTTSQIFVVPVMGIMVVIENSNVTETYFNMTKSEVSAGNIADVNVS